MVDEAEERAREYSGLQLDGWEFYHPLSKVCSYCAHKTLSLRHTCAAFPAGIPRPIWLAEHDHTSPYPGDGGVLFRRRTEADTRAQLEALGLKPAEGV